MGDVEGMNETSLCVCHHIKDVFTLRLPAFFNFILQNEFSFSEFHIPTSEKKSLVRLLLFSWTLTESRAVLDVVGTQKGNGSLSFVSDLVSAQHVINHI